MTRNDPGAARLLAASARLRAAPSIEQGDSARLSEIALAVLLEEWRRENDLASFPSCIRLRPPREKDWIVVDDVRRMLMLDDLHRLALAEKGKMAHGLQLRG